VAVAGTILVLLARKFEYTRETLLKFEEDEKEREIAAAKKKRSGDGGLFGGFGDEVRVCWGEVCSQ